VRRYPFYLAQRAGADSDRRVVCVDEGGLSREAPPLVHPNGEPTPLWESTHRFLTDLHQAERQTAALCQRLQEEALLEDFDAALELRGGGARRLAGMLRVSEDRLKALPPERLKALLDEGILPRIYAHLISLDNFAVLLDRYAARAKR
jgi:hypothetical protein